MKIVDLSHSIHSEISVFPGTEPPKLEQATSLEKDGFVEHKITMYTHTGTHIDVPSHISADGLTIDQLDIDHFMGKAAVIDLTEFKAEVINKEILAPYASLISKIEYLILRTGWEKYWGHRRYFKGFPSLDPGAAQWLGTFKLKGIGIDTISIEPVESKTFPVHRILFKNNIMIVENLAHLEKVGDEIFTFSCLPLKFKKGDGSPVRAVGIL
jgi:arylformamidase